MMKKLFVIMTFFVIAAGLAGCNTVEGVGRDIEKAGQSIQKL